MEKSKGVKKKFAHFKKNVIPEKKKFHARIFFFIPVKKTVVPVKKTVVPEEKKNSRVKFFFHVYEKNSRTGEKKIHIYVFGQISRKKMICFFVFQYFFVFRYDFYGKIDLFRLRRCVLSTISR
jgi:hypothetical protein